MSWYLLKHQTVRGSVPRNVGICAENVRIRTSHYLLLSLFSYSMQLFCQAEAKILCCLFHFIWGSK